MGSAKGTTRRSISCSKTRACASSHSSWRSSLSNSQALVAGKTAVQGQFQLPLPPAQCASGIIGHPTCIVLSFHNRLQHLPSGYAEQVSRHRRYFDVASLAQLLDPILHPIHVFQHVHALPGQIFKLADFSRWHPASLQLATLQQSGNPFRILGEWIAGLLEGGKLKGSLPPSSSPAIHSASLGSVL